MVEGRTWTRLQITMGVDPRTAGTRVERQGDQVESDTLTAATVENATMRRAILDEMAIEEAGGYNGARLRGQRDNVESANMVRSDSSQKGLKGFELKQQTTWRVGSNPS